MKDEMRKYAFESVLLESNTGPGEDWLYIQYYYHMTHIKGCYQPVTS